MDPISTQELMDEPVSTQQLLIDNATFKAALSMTLNFEGGIDRNEVGKSGITNAGITQQTYDNYRKQKKMPLKDVTLLDPIEQQEFYYEEFYERPGFNRLSDKSAIMMFDFGVNASPKTAVKALQRSVGAVPDGVLGPKTEKAVKEFIEENGEDELLQKIIDERERHNANLIKKSPKTYQKFEAGWNNRIKQIKETFNLSALNPFAVTEAEAATGEVMDGALTTGDLLAGGERFDDAGFTTADLTKPAEVKLIDKVAAHAAAAITVAVAKSQQAQSDIAKSFAIGSAQIGSAFGNMLDWFGQNVGELDVTGGNLYEQEHEDIFNDMEKMGIAQADIDAIRAEIDKLDEADARRQAIVKGVGDKISQMGSAIQKFISKEQAALAETRDPETFRGEFMQNPSFTRTVALIAEAVPSLGVATLVTFLTKNPFAGAASISFPLEGADTYRQAREAGKSIPTSNALFLASGLGTSLLETIPLTRFLRGGSGKVGKDILVGAIQEGSEEVAQAAWNNSIAKIGFDETRKIYEGMVEGFIAGAGAGGLIGGLSSGRAGDLDKAMNTAIEKGMTPQDLQTMAESVGAEIIANKEAIDEVITKNANFESRNNFTPEQMVDFKNLKDWEADQQSGGKFSFGPIEDLTHLGIPSGHSQAMQDIGPKNAFALIDKVLNNELLTEPEMAKVQRLLADYQNVKPQIDAINKEIEDARQQLTEQEQREVLESFTQETGNVDYDWDGNIIPKEGEQVEEPEAKYGKGDVFFSKLERALDEKMPASAPAEQVRGILRSAGVKQDEIDHLDLDTFLADKPKVNKEDLLEYVRQNKVEIEEVEKGIVKRSKADLLKQARKIIDDKGRDSWVTNIGSSQLAIDEVEDGYTAQIQDSPLQPWQPLGIFETIDEAAEALVQKIDELKPKTTTKFSLHQLPGGKNYRELLLRLPFKELTDAEVKAAVESGRVPPEGGINFRSSHFDEPNVLAHVRFNERQDADGNKILFLEEVQSDWHQKGRKRGYKPADIQKQINDLDQRVVDIELKGKDATQAEKQEWADLKNKRPKLIEQYDSPPDAPFKKNWHELVLKRMIRYAAENGYDKLAWTSGQQQAERYDLSKHIDFVHWKENGDLRIHKIEDPESKLTTVAANVSKDKLADYIGKDAAEKIINEKADEYNYRSLKGVDMKVGGEGMKGFYDQILPSYVNKYVKKWGSKVEPVEISIGSDTDRIASLRKSIAQAELDDDPEMAAIYREELAGLSPDVMVHGIRITPAMKQSVMVEGQALFEKPENYDIVVSKQLTFDDLLPEKEVSGGKQTVSDSERNLTIDSAKGLKTIFESPFAIKFKKDGYLAVPASQVTSPADVAFAFQFLKDAGLEHFYVGAIKDGQIVSVELLSLGTINYAAVSTFEMFNLLQATDADGYFVVHNHPSGYVHPSREDLDITRKIIKAIPGKKFYGHIIINDGKYGYINEQNEFEERQHKDYAKTRKVPLLRKYTQWAKSKNLLSTPKLRSSADVFELAKGINTSQDETLMLNMDFSHKILAAYILPKGFVTYENVADIAARNRSIRIILVGPGQNIASVPGDSLRQLKSDLANANITLLDKITIKPDGHYISYADEGVFEPGGDYKLPPKDAMRESLEKKRALFMKLGKEIPKFKNTQEALAYGQFIRGDQPAIDRLREALKAKNKETNANFAIENPTEEQIQAGGDLAFEGQLLREALEEAVPVQGTKTADLLGDEPEKERSLKIDSENPIQERSGDDIPEGAAKIKTIIDKLRGEKADPIKSPQEFAEFLSQLTKFAQSYAILRKGFRSSKAAGLFSPKGGKPGIIKVHQDVLVNDQEYMETLAHELGHALEYNVVGRVNSKEFELFGKNLDYNTIQKLRAELIAVTESLSPGSTTGEQKRYYLRPAELTARFFEKLLASPGNLNELAPTALELIEKQALLHPMIHEFLEAADKGIDKGAPKVVLLRDLKQTYQKYLGKRVGNIAFGEEMAYRAMKERGKLALETMIDEKFKNVKDAPDLLFRAAESIKISRNGVPEFGTRDFVTAKNEEEEQALYNAGYDLVEMPDLEDGEARPVFAKWRYTEAEGKRIFDSLSDKGKQLILGFTEERQNAKDYFNREVIKDVNNINGNIEGWVHHYFEDRPGSKIQSGQKFKTRLAGTRKHRTGTEGYVEDFKKAMTKVLIDLEDEKVYNDFIKRQFARVTEPIAEGREPKPGWVEVQGTLKSGVGLPQETKKTLIDSATGKAIPIKQSRYQMPREIYERYKLWRGLIDEATTMVRIVNDINRYWRVNILAHPGTAMTNFFSGGIQFSSKILTDFYTEVLTGNAKMPQTKANLSAMIKVLTPKGWLEAPDWVYGGDLTNFYGQFMKQKSPVSAAIDTYGNKALKFFGLIERYWKKVILTANNVADIESLGKMTPDGLRLPTEGERQILAMLNNEVDLYAYDYDNVPAWLEAHQKSAMGQAIKPFAKYPYKYAKHVLDLAGAAFDGSLPWQTRLAKIMTLTTLVAAYAAFSRKRKEEQQTPEAEKGVDIPARLQPRGRLFIHTDDQGREMFVRVAKYPFLNLSEAAMQLVEGNFEGAKDLTAEMLGTIGPAAQIGLLAINYRNKFQTYDSVPVILGDSLVTFMPGYRILNDVSRMLDPYQRKQETFAQAFTKIIPTTSEALQEKLHGKIRTERVPVEGEIHGAIGSRTTIDHALESYWQDVLLSLLSGIYINRVDPAIAEAYIIRKTKNIEKQKKEDEKKQYQYSK